MTKTELEALRAAYEVLRTLASPEAVHAEELCRKALIEAGELRRSPFVFPT